MPEFRRYTGAEAAVTTYASDNSPASLPIDDSGRFSVEERG
jgi:hypothetical protein